MSAHCSKMVSLEQLTVGSVNTDWRCCLKAGIWTDTSKHVTHLHRFFLYVVRMSPQGVQVHCREMHFITRYMRGGPLLRLVALMCAVNVAPLLSAAVDWSCSPSWPVLRCGRLPLLLWTTWRRVRAAWTGSARWSRRCWRRARAASWWSSSASWR
jgi:hypothetical protein